VGSERRDGHGAWRPSGIVTLTTDFGVRDTFVGVMKGVLHGIAPPVRVIDLTHEVPAQDVRSAAFHLRHAWRWFPVGTVHVVVVDPGVGSARGILLARQAGQAFLAPDNGLLSGLLEPGAEVRALDVERVALVPRSRTFHGRDVFAPAAAQLVAGASPEQLAPRTVPALALEWPRPRALPGGGFAAPIELVDRFGNAITALDGERLDPGAAGGWVARCGGRELPLAGTYSEVAPGQPLALLDSFGRWEVAVRDGDAARELGLARGDEVQFLPKGGSRS
jgi:S-adenosylmethionine hydrolase